MSEPNHDVLAPCPFCNFTKEEFARHNKSAGIYACPWEQYRPQLFWDRVSNAWAVECQNCGIVVLLYERAEADAVNVWNRAKRAK